MNDTAAIPAEAVALSREAAHDLQLAATSALLARQRTSAAMLRPGWDAANLTEAAALLRALRDTQQRLVALAQKGGRA